VREHPSVFSLSSLRVLKAHPDVLGGWLEGVTTFEGEPGLPAVKEQLGIS
jgi:hypothetical protein